MFKSTLSVSVLALSMAASSYVLADDHALAHQTASPEGASVYIISPKNGETVEKTFIVKFGLSGMEVVPAGSEKANAGHHHLLIDGKVPSMSQPLGANVKHFGGGQTESEITLESGQHTLQLILGDHLHVPHNPPVISDVVTITVK